MGDVQDRVMIRRISQGSIQNAWIRGTVFPILPRVCCVTSTALLFCTVILNYARGISLTLEHLSHSLLSTDGKYRRMRGTGKKQEEEILQILSNPSDFINIPPTFFFSKVSKWHTCQTLQNVILDSYLIIAMPSEIPCQVLQIVTNISESYKGHAFLFWRKRQQQPPPCKARQNRKPLPIFLLLFPYWKP